MKKNALLLCFCCKMGKGLVSRVCFNGGSTLSSVCDTGSGQKRTEHGDDGRLFLIGDDAPFPLVLT